MRLNKRSEGYINYVKGVKREKKKCIILPAINFNWFYCNLGTFS